MKDELDQFAKTLNPATSPRLLKAVTDTTAMMRWGYAGEAAIMIDCSVTEYLEILRLSLGRRIGILLVEGVGHGHAFDGPLHDAINHHRCLDACGFKDGRDDVNDMMELGTKAANVLDTVWPRDRHPLPCATEVRRYLRSNAHAHLRTSASALYSPLAL